MSTEIYSLDHFAIKCVARVIKPRDQKVIDSLSNLKSDIFKYCVDNSLCCTHNNQVFIELFPHNEDAEGATSIDELIDTLLKNVDRENVRLKDGAVEELAPYYWCPMDQYEEFNRAKERGRKPMCMHCGDELQIKFVEVKVYAVNESNKLEEVVTYHDPVCCECKEEVEDLTTIESIADIFGWA